MLLQLELRILKDQQPVLFPLPPELPVAVYTSSFGTVMFSVRATITLSFVLTSKHLLVPEARVREGKLPPQGLPLRSESKA